MVFLKHYFAYFSLQLKEKLALLPTNLQSANNDIAFYKEKHENMLQLRPVLANVSHEFSIQNLKIMSLSASDSRFINSKKAKSQNSRQRASSCWSRCANTGVNWREYVPPRDHSACWSTSILF
jgi:hypothetical protein